MWEEKDCFVALLSVRINEKKNTNPKQTRIASDNLLNQFSCH